MFLQRNEIGKNDLQYKTYSVNKHILVLHFHLVFFEICILKVSKSKTKYY